MGIYTDTIQDYYYEIYEKKKGDYENGLSEYCNKGFNWRSTALIC